MTATTTERYWEFYDDQTNENFSDLSYVSLTGETVMVPIEDDIVTQVYEIRRKNGAATEIKVYAR